ncbi:MAG TPA: HD domain-containing protein [Spirochaetia bacterium]|nr:HD domain-containing protein [Spirochaetia bacterium]HTZ50379.1 HD domain-containing protein [Spirochaetia bacterium]
MSGNPPDAAAPPAPGLIGVARALDFAARKHAHQRRKGINAEPYVNHLTEVALLLAEATGGSDAGVVMAGLLHDTIEDTETTFAELQAAFGPDVASLVAEVTDDTRLPREERRRRQVESAPAKTARARMIKLADKIANLHSIAESPPVGWSSRRKNEYVAWAREVAAACGPTNPLLERLFDEASRRLE